MLSILNAFPFSCRQVDKMKIKLNNLLKGRQLSFMWKIKCKRNPLQYFRFHRSLYVAQTKSLTFVIAISLSLSLSLSLSSSLFLYLFELITHGAASSLSKAAGETERQPTVPSNLGQPLSVSECYVNYSDAAQKGPALWMKGDFPFLLLLLLGKLEKLMEKLLTRPFLSRPLVKLNAVISFSRGAFLI